MNMILICLVHDFDFHIQLNSVMEINISGFIVNSNELMYRWQEIEIHCIIHGDKLWFPCTWNADTPNANLHHNIQCTQANRTRSGSSTPNCPRPSGGSSGHSDTNPSGRSQSSSNCNNHNTSASGHVTHSKGNGWQQHQSGDDDVGSESSEGQQMGNCDDIDNEDVIDNEPRFPPQTSSTLSHYSHWSSVNNKGGVLMHPVRHWYPTDNHSMQSDSPPSSQWQVSRSRYNQPCIQLWPFLVSNT